MPGHGARRSVELLERYGNRIQLFHVKDMADGAFPGRIEIVGEGIIDFPTIFAASKGPVRYYVVEHDPRFGDQTFNPFEAAEKGFNYLDCVTFGRD
jgi:sugar phosphate isomerase/epimerase